ncbi:MAG TPA: glycosyltransferase [Rubricoccaceae bacterium]|nr:glycosyltransferase [Rubricoccaceae bacterium]
MAALTVAAGVLLALGVVYAAAIGAFAVGFMRVLRGERTRGRRGDLPFVSVIIPARDEAASIEACLSSVFANDCPPDRFEVIVVDDLSADDTPAVVRRLMPRWNPPGAPERLRLLQMPENLERLRAHKKRAIEKGIEAARGSLILTTDADCFVPPGWIREMAACFEDADADPGMKPVTAFVSGPVLFCSGDHPLLHMQALEFLGLVAAGAGAIGIGRPTICNGANVAYRKDVFQALGGFRGIDHLTSGDDELLMQKVAAETPHRVRFCAAPEAAVVTEPLRSLRAFFGQRRRWASKGAHYPSRPLVALLVGIYGFYFGLLVGVLAWPFVPALGGPLLGAFALKVLPEAALLGPACRHFGRARLFAYFLPEQVLHVPYIVVLGAAGAFGRYEWKGRRVVR